MKITKMVMQLSCTIWITHQSSYLQTLSLTTTGNLSVDLKFGASVPAAGLKVLFIGEFRNQLQISYQAQPRNLYDV